jgi:hypothetical protein
MRVTLLPLEVRIPVLARGVRVSLAVALSALAGAWLPRVATWLLLVADAGLPLATAQLAVAVALLALPVALLALAVAVLALAVALLPTAVPVRVPDRAVRLGACLGVPVGCGLPGCRRRAARMAGLCCWCLRRADDIVGEPLDRRREHVRERGGRGPAQDEGCGRGCRRGLRAKP